MSKKREADAPDDGKQRDASESTYTAQRPARVRTGLGARWFAWLLSNGDRFDRSLYAAYKSDLIGGLRGAVVEIGPGDGVNLPYYPAGVHWTGVEPNVHFHPRLRKRAAALDLCAEVVGGVAERLPLADAVADAVVSTLVLCSVGDVAATLAEVRRVLKPGGTFVFIEHVAAPAGSRLGRVQRFVKPAWGLIADGCRPDRETGRAIAEAGFADVQLNRFEADLPVPIVRPHIVGTARRA